MDANSPHAAQPTRTSPRAETKLLAIPATSPHSNVPGEMVEIPAAKLDLNIEMRVRECGFYQSMLPVGEELGDCYNFHVKRFQRDLPWTKRL